MRTQRKSRKHFSPRLFSLEDRTVPTTFTVTTNAGNADSGSLRAAILAANANLGPDTIIFNSFFDTPQTIVLTVGQLPITGSLTITGPAGGVTINGNNSGRVFNISGTGNIVVGMSDLTITGGNETGTNQGGGILIADEVVTLTRCTVRNNTTQSAGGGVTVVGGSLTVQDSTFSGNIASAAGAIYFNGPPLAGGFTVRNSTISGNSATTTIGGGISLGLGFNGTCKI